MKRYSTSGPATILAVPTIVANYGPGLFSIPRFQGYSQALNSDGILAYGGLVENTFPLISDIITVDNAAFPSFDIIYLGKYALQEGVHFSGVNGDTDLTAAALATAINGLPDWSAVALTNQVTITYQANQLGEIPFSVQNRKDPANFLLSSSTGYITGQIVFSPIDLL